ncbi:MAG: hypothetical protein WBX26_10555 [Candidatus Cybelea sp.]
MKRWFVGLAFVGTFVASAMTTLAATAQPVPSTSPSPMTSPTPMSTMRP